MKGEKKTIRRGMDDEHDIKGSKNEDRYDHEKMEGNRDGKECPTAIKKGEV